MQFSTKKPLLSLTLVCSISILVSNVYADGLKIKPGMWESTMTTTNSMTGTTTDTSTTCMVEEEFDPMSMLEGTADCELTENTLSGNTLSYSMSCNIQGAVSQIQGVYKVDGDEGEGTMNMEMDFGGQKMTMENVFTAKRIGDC